MKHRTNLTSRSLSSRLTMKYPSLMVPLGLLYASFIIGLVDASSCSLCSPGEFLSSLCKCLPCPIDTFNDKINNDSECRPCKKRCEPSMVVRKMCTRTHDTVCACKYGKYHDPGILFCMDCTICEPGFGAARPCSTDSNTVCLPCIPGRTYSNGTSFSDPCTPCTVCPPGYTMRKNCTNTSDTVCQRSLHANTTQKTGTQTPKVSTTTNGSLASQTNKKKDFLVPVLAVVVLLLVCLLICVIIKLYRRSRARRRQPPGAGHDSEDGAEEVIPHEKTKSFPPSTSRHVGLRGRHTRHVRRNDNSRDSDSQGSSTGSLQEEKPRDPERLLRELPNETLLIENLAFLLNPKSRKNWVRLAGELGYSKTEVDCFAIEPTNATQRLLGDWRTMNSSTVGELYRCLRKINRDDACELLEAA